MPGVLKVPGWISGRYTDLWREFAKYVHVALMRNCPIKGGGNGQ